VNEAIRTVGFVGTGIMGAPMARHLAAAGFLVTAYNRSIEKAMRLAEHGVRLASSAAEACAGQDVVVVMLNSGQVCEELLFAPETGALFAMRPGCLLIVMSSLKVETAKDHARRSQAVGVGYLDAPVSGGEVGAKAATLSIMVGGETADVARAWPLLEAMGRPLHMGPTGTGQLTKLANQLTVASTIVAVAEALLLAERGGADPAKVREALLGGFAQSKILDLHGRRMIAGDFVPGGTAINQIKDTQAAIELTQELSLELPMLELTDSLFRDLVDHGHGELDHSALILELRRRNSAEEKQ
jgi:3-hydroxyisobutyrate dehydrogenase-like beta-hydroxyacid dehydrogenase